MGSRRYKDIAEGQGVSCHWERKAPDQARDPRSSQGGREGCREGMTERGCRGKQAEDRGGQEDDGRRVPGMTGRRPGMETGNEPRKGERKGEGRGENGPPAQEIPGGWSC